MSLTVDAVTRDNIDSLLDEHRLQVRMRNKRSDPPHVERWWTIRRNGQTWRGKRDKQQIRVPIKGGLNVYGKITERDFLSDGTLDPEYYRIDPARGV
jgi:hypothetical protein